MRIAQNHSTTTAAAATSIPIGTTTTSVQLSCIVCSSVARPSSIYCSDDCIRKHASTTTTQLTATATTTTTDAKSTRDEITPIVANKNNRVDVYEPKTGRCLTGNSAPTVENLSQWLQQHQTFEVVHSGSAQAMAIRAKKMQLIQLNNKSMANPPKGVQIPQKIQATLTVGPSKRVVLVNPHRNSPASGSGKTTITAAQSTPTPQQPQLIRKNTPIKLVEKTPIKSTPPPPPQSPLLPTKTIAPKSGSSTKSGQPVPAAATTPIPNPKRKPDSPPTTAPPVKSAEPVRVNVQRTLKEQLQLRMNELDATAARLTADEIDRFAKETERECYQLFSRDTGTKYRAKYRSLMFNIKDRKNATLFRKICEKQLQPKQLVRMTADELASQELAMWRENENKHQLEMIKKSELDLLACAKSYVLKTHKGEELIENKQTDRVQLDMNVSVEDVVSILNNSIVSSTSESSPITLSSSDLVTPAASSSLQPEKPTKDTRIDSRFEKYMDSSKQSTSSSTSSSNKKKSAKRSRSRSRDGDSKKNSSKHKRKRSRERRSRSRSTDRSGSTKDKQRSSSSNSSAKKTSPATQQQSSSKLPPKPLIKDNFNLIDKILEAQSTIDRILHPEENHHQKETPTPKKPSELETTIIPEDTMDQEQPSSTVTIPTPPESQLTPSPPPSLSVPKTRPAAINSPDTVWSGNIIMVDVATFQIAIQPIAGDCSKIARDLPVELDVVGRIRPDTVWEYISKIKRMQKEVLIVGFAAGTDDDQEAFDTLFKYLTARQRFGVIKTKSSSIKDFYVLPLDEKAMPDDLLPAGMTFDTSDGADMLIGVVVKNTPAVPAVKRSASAAMVVVPNKVSGARIMCLC